MENHGHPFALRRRLQRHQPLSSETHARRPTTGPSACGISLDQAGDAHRHITSYAAPGCCLRAYSSTARTMLLDPLVCG